MDSENLIYPKHRREGKGYARNLFKAAMTEKMRTTTSDKYFFFRDIDHDANFLNDRSYHAFGIVDKVYSEVEQPSGKDLVCRFFKAFECTVESVWRTYSEVELFEVDKWEWDNLRTMLDEIEEIEK